jgi:hypothetical protein
MYLDVVCPHCQEKTAVPIRLAGRALKCPKCKQDLRETVKKAYENRPREGLSVAALSTWLLVGGLVVAMIILFVSQIGQLHRGGEDELAKANWTNFVSNTGLFQVQLPGVPTTEQMRFPSPVGAISTRLHIVETRDYRFQVGVATLPAGRTPPGSVDDILDATAAKVLVEWEAAKVSARRIASQGHSGLEVVYKLHHQPRAGVLRLYLVKRSFILLAALGPGLDPTTPGIRRFLNSLEFSKN